MAGILKSASTTVSTTFGVVTKTISVGGNAIDSLALGAEMLHLNVQEAHRNTKEDILRDRRERRRERRIEDHERTKKHFTDVQKHLRFVESLSEEDRKLYLMIHSDLSADTDSENENESGDEVISLINP